MILYLILKLACLAICMAYLTPMKYAAKKSAVLLFIFQSLILAMNYGLYLCFGLRTYSLISILTIGIPGFFCFNYLAKYRGFRVLFSLLTVTLFGILCSYLGSLADSYFSIPAAQYAIKFSCFILITLYIAKVLRKPYLTLVQTLDKGWGALCIIPLLLIGIACLLEFCPSPISGFLWNTVLVFLVFAMAFVFYAIMFANFRNILEYFELKRSREALTLQAQMYKSEYKTLMENLQSIRIFRHDMRHHISAINALLGDSNISDARKYIWKLDGSLSDGIVEKHCENTGVNAVLSSLISRATSEGIEVDCAADIPEDTPIDSMELGLVFANAIDNAINACRKLENPADRKITVDCREHGGQLYIRVSNPFAGEVSFEGEFPVPEEAEHGIGTKSIAAIAEKHGGFYSFSAQNGVFKTSVTLKY